MENNTATPNQLIQMFTITTGNARRDGRQPSHDGEFITIYYRVGDSDLIAEHNGGTFCLDDLEGEEREWIDEAYSRKSKNDGEVCKHAGSEAIAEMIQLGWLRPDQREGNRIFQERA